MEITEVSHVKIPCLLNTRWQTSSNLSERVYNSNMRMFVTKDPKFTGAKLQFQNNYNVE